MRFPVSTPIKPSNQPHVRQIASVVKTISLYTNQPYPSRIDCNAVATSMTRCNPCQIVLTPGSPSLLLARMPPSWAINRSTSLSRSGAFGCLPGPRPSRSTPRPSTCSKCWNPHEHRERTHHVRQMLANFRLDRAGQGRRASALGIHRRHGHAR